MYRKYLLIGLFVVLLSASIASAGLFDFLKKDDNDSVYTITKDNDKELYDFIENLVLIESEPDMYITKILDEVSEQKCVNNICEWTGYQRKHFNNYSGNYYAFGNFTEVNLINGQLVYTSLNGEQINITAI